MTRRKMPEGGPEFMFVSGIGRKKVQAERLDAEATVKS